MTEAVILKGVPIPPKPPRKIAARKPKYDIANLTVGEMLFIPGGKPSIKQTVNKQAKTLGFKVHVAPHEHTDGTAGMGIWRQHKDA